MRKVIGVFLVMAVIHLLSAAPAAAGRWHHHHRHHPHHGYTHHGDAFWVSLGVGLFSGVVLSHLLSPPRPRQTVVYHTAPPVYHVPPAVVYEQPATVIYRSPPAVVYQSSPTRTALPRVSEYFGPQPEVILRTVAPTPTLLNLRSGPGSDAEIIGQASNGERLDVIGAAPDWLYVKTVSGTYGWVMSRYTTELASPMG